LAYFNDVGDGEYEKKRGVHRFNRGTDGWPDYETVLQSWDRKDRDGNLLCHGDVRCVRNHKGHLLRGRVYGGDKPAGLTCAKCDEQETCPESPAWKARRCATSAAKLRAYMRAAYAQALRADSDPSAPAAMLAFDIGSNPIADVAAMPQFNRVGDRKLSESELRALWRRLSATDTPAAVVQWGTRPDQRTVRTTLAERPDQPLGPPATLVIGRVAALDLAWFESRFHPNAVGDNGRSFGLFQIQPPTAKVESNILTNPRTASYIAVDLIRRSFQACAKRPYEERLSWYVSSNGCPSSPIIVKKSMDRLLMATRILPMLNPPPPPALSPRK
jgi:hypothetical protein